MPRTATSPNTRTATPEQLDEHRRLHNLIPAHAEKIERPDVTDAVLYRYAYATHRGPATRLLGFVGRQRKPAWDVAYIEADAGIRRRIDGWFNQQEMWTSWKAEQRAARRRGPDMSRYALGTILHYQVSYSLTRNFYYQVVAVHGQTVTLRRLQNVVLTGGGWTGTEQTVKDAFADDATIKARVTGSGACIDGRHATPWDGTPNYYNTLD